MGRLVGSGVTAGVVGAIVWFLLGSAIVSGIFGVIAFFLTMFGDSILAASQASQPQCGPRSWRRLVVRLLRRFLVRRFELGLQRQRVFRRRRQFRRRRRLGELVGEVMGIGRISKHLIEHRGGCGGFSRKRRST